MPERDFEQIIQALEGAPSEAFRQRLRTQLMAAARVKISESKEEETNMTPKMVPYVREGMHTVNPYLVVHGAVGAAGLCHACVRTARSGCGWPTSRGSFATPKSGSATWCCELADANETLRRQTMPLHVYVEDVDEVYRKALQEPGTTSLYAPVDQDYGDREASVRDASGTTWYIATHKDGRHQREGLWKVTPYLHVKGSADLVVFLQSALGAETIEMAAAPDGSVAHCKMRIGDSVVELSEAHGEWGPVTGPPAHLCAGCGRQLTRMRWRRERSHCRSRRIGRMATGRPASGTRGATRGGSPPGWDRRPGRMRGGAAFQTAPLRTIEV